LLRGKVDKGAYYDLRDYDCNTLASVLKLYFRELPEPLIPVNMYKNFLATQQLSDENERVNTIKDLVSQLPNANKALLIRLIVFLALIASKNDINKMTATNLAVVFAPNLFRDGTNDNYAIINDTPFINNIVTSMITHCDYIFNIEAEENPPVDYYQTQESDYSDQYYGEYEDQYTNTQACTNELEAKFSMQAPQNSIPALPQKPVENATNTGTPADGTRDRSGATKLQNSRAEVLRQIAKQIADKKAAHEASRGEQPSQDTSN